MGGTIKPLELAGWAVRWVTRCSGGQDVDTSSSTPSAAYTLRCAGVTDLSFVCDLRERTLRKHIDDAFGWDAAEQRSGYEKLLRDADAWVVVVDSEDVGFLHFEMERDGGRLHEIVIRPESQDLGLGSTIIRDLCHECASADVPLELAVLRANTAAIRLYERMEFVIFKESEQALWMRWWAR